MDRPSAVRAEGGISSNGSSSTSWRPLRLPRRRRRQARQRQPRPRRRPRAATHRRPAAAEGAVRRLYSQISDVVAAGGSRDGEHGRGHVRDAATLGPGPLRGLVTRPCTRRSAATRSSTRSGELGGRCLGPRVAIGAGPGRLQPGRVPRAAKTTRRASPCDRARTWNSIFTNASRLRR